MRRSDLLDDEMLFEFYDERLGERRGVGAPLRPVVEGRPPRRARTARSDAGACSPTGAASTSTTTPTRGGRATPSSELAYRYAPDTPLDGASLTVPLTALNQVTADGPRLGHPRLPPRAGGDAGALAAEGHPPPPDPDERDRRRRRWQRLPGRRCRSGTPLVDSAGSGARPRRRGQRGRRRPTSISTACRPTCGCTSSSSTTRATRSTPATTSTRSVPVRRAARGRRSRRPPRSTSAATSCAGTSARSSGSSSSRVDGGHVVRAYPTLLDRGDSVSLKVVDNEALQQRAMRGGVRRLLLMAAAPTPAKVERVLDGPMKLAIAASGIALARPHRRLHRSRRRRGDGAPRPAVGRPGVRRASNARCATATPQIAADALAVAADVLAAAGRVRKRTGCADRRGAAADGRRCRGPPRSAGRPRLRSPRRRRPPARRAPLRARHRVPPRSPRRRRRSRPAADGRGAPDRARVRRRRWRRSNACPTTLRNIAWMIEELRMSVFAQPLGVDGPVSAKRIRQEIDVASSVATTPDRSAYIPTMSYDGARSRFPACLVGGGRRVPVVGGHARHRLQLRCVLRVDERRVRRRCRRDGGRCSGSRPSRSSG